MIVPRTLPSALFLLLAACGGGLDDDSPGEGDSDGSSDTGDAGEQPTPLLHGELVIDLQPVEVAPLGAYFTETGGSLRAEAGIDLGFGDGYPRTLELRLDEAWGMCSPLVGDLRLDTIASSDPTLGVELRDTRGFAVSATTEGVYAVTVIGTFTPSQPVGCAEGIGVGVPLSLEIAATVRVARPAGAGLHMPRTCQDASVARVESGALLPDYGVDALTIAVLAADGTALHLDNATGHRPITVTVQADEDTGLRLFDAPRGLAALQATGSDDTLVVEALGAEIGRFELVDEGRIDALDVGFELLGMAAGSTLLQSGGTYGDDGWARTSSSLGMYLTAQLVDGDPLCTIPRDDAFVLNSSTPAHCVAMDAPGHGLSYGPIQLPVSAEVVASGTCALHLSAPGYAAGAGWAVDFAAEIRNAEGLIRPAGR